MRRNFGKDANVHWIDLNQPSHEELEAVRDEFNLYPAFVQDCQDPAHLPKLERYDGTTFLIVRLANPEAADDADTLQSLTRKISIFVQKDQVLSFSRLDADVFEKMIGQSIEDTKNKPLKGHEQTPAVLVSFLNRVFDTFHGPLEAAEDSLDSFEDALFARATGLDHWQEILTVKRRLSLMKRILIHSQDVVQKLSPPGEVYFPLFQDLRENVSTLIFLTDELLEDVTNLLNLQISLSSQKTNEVMRVLTVFSVLFMPITFIVGIYGMNFQHMPELGWRDGYLYVWVLMITVTALISVWFYRKGWLKNLV